MRTQKRKPQKSRPCVFCSLWHDLIFAVDVTLDTDMAHPTLEISNDGKSVKDTGTIRNIPSKEKRFDSHALLLAKEGYTSGRHYWQVDVGKRRSWALGIAWETHSNKVFPDVQRKPLVFHFVLVLVASCPVTGATGKSLLHPPFRN